MVSSQALVTRCVRGENIRTTTLSQTTVQQREIRDRTNGDEKSLSSRLSPNPSNRKHEQCHPSASQPDLSNPPSSAAAKSNAQPSSRRVSHHKTTAPETVTPKARSRKNKAPIRRRRSSIRVRRRRRLGTRRIRGAGVVGRMVGRRSECWMSVGISGMKQQRGVEEGCGILECGNLMQGRCVIWDVKIQAFNGCT